MKIDSVEAIPLTARLKKAQTTSQASYTEISICLVKVRTDEGYWTQVERYITEHTGAMFSHSLCPDCATELFPQDIVDATPQKV